MRFMMLMIPNEKAYKAGARPNAEAMAKMTAYNETLAKAGVLLSLDGLQTPAKGARVSFSSGKPVVTDGPLIATKDALGGYWMIRVQSKAEAVEWATRCPAEGGDVIELRQVYELDDFEPSEAVERARKLGLPTAQISI